MAPTDMTAPSPSPPTRPPPHTIRIFEYDPSKPLDVGKNPLQIDQIRIPYERRIPRRERAAIEAVRAKYPNRPQPSIMIATNNELAATITLAHPSVQVLQNANAQALLSQAVMNILRSPEVRSELAKIMRTAEQPDQPTKR